jgi:uridine kinase
MNKNYIYIPMGNDIFDSKYLKPSSIQPINDQIIFLPPSFAFILTEIYESLFHYLEQKPIISEYILSTYFHERKINVKRIHLPYTLILSPSRIIAVSGDSASGKSTLVSAIQNVFPFDSNLLLETDRYHKWERQNPIWNTLTHLHPEANNLEKLLNDTYQLKIGNDIFMVDYDHECGRFTNSKLIESKPVILLCGLHTFYDDKLRNTSDLKIFVNTEDKLKTFWKIQRDLQKRNYSKEEILQKIKKRENDFIQHILPQKEFADIIIHYTSESVPDDISIELNESQFCMKVEIKNNLLAYVYHSLFPFTSSIHSNERNTAMIFCIKPNIQRQEIPLQEENIEAGYLGIIQLLILRIFYTSFHGS